MTLTTTQQKYLNEAISLQKEIYSLSEDFTFTLVPGIDIECQFEYYDTQKMLIYCDLKNTDPKNKDLETFIEIINSTINEYYGDWSISSALGEHLEIPKEKNKKINLLFKELEKVKNKLYGCFSSYKNKNEYISLIDKIIECPEKYNIEMLEKEFKKLTKKEEKEEKNKLKELENQLKQIKNPKTKNKLSKLLK